MRPNKDNKNEILSGHKRIEAAKRLGLVGIPVIVEGGQGERNGLLDILDDKTCGQVANKSKSRDRIAEQYAFSEKL